MMAAAKNVFESGAAVHISKFHMSCKTTVMRMRKNRLSRLLATLHRRLVFMKSAGRANIRAEGIVTY
jgi:hypothetical protein